MSELELEYQHPDNGKWYPSVYPADEKAHAERETGFVYRIIKKPKATPPVAKQPHYAAIKPEPIDVIEGWNLNFYRANALKYIARAGKKDATTEGTIKDLEKAISYLKRECNALRGTPSWD